MSRQSSEKPFEVLTEDLATVTAPRDPGVRSLAEGRPDRRRGFQQNPRNPPVITQAKLSGPTAAAHPNFPGEQAGPKDGPIRVSVAEAVPSPMRRTKRAHRCPSSEDAAAVSPARPHLELGPMVPEQRCSLGKQAVFSCSAVLPEAQTHRRCINEKAGASSG